MRIVTQYLVVHGEVANGIFEQLVQSKVATGYQPYGTPFFTRDMNYNVIGHQSIVFYKEFYDASSESLPVSPRLPEQTLSHSG